MEDFEKGEFSIDRKKLQIINLFISNFWLTYLKISRKKKF